MEEARLIIKVSAALYGLGLLAACAGPRCTVAARLLAWVAAGCGFAYVGLRYSLAWPMTPMFMGTAAIPPVLAAIGALRAGRQGGFFLSGTLALAFLLAGLSVAFPKDFYLPFIKTLSPFSHLMLGLGVAGKACLLAAGVAAAPVLFRAGGGEGDFFSWVVWGFALWTLALFAGEMWSYSGWGIPVVWEDPTIITAMATWFFYVGLMHLHLTRSAGPGVRAGVAVAGVAVVLVLNCGPDLGPFRPPFGP